jgi:hypothetical protein
MHRDGYELFYEVAGSYSIPYQEALAEAEALVTNSCRLSTAEAA